jgi:hypothetical protein
MFSLIPGYCSLMVYSAADGEAIFNRVAPGLPKQNFTSALVSPGGETTCDGPITSNTANSCFPSSSLLPGVEYRASSGLLAVYGTNWNNRDNSTPIFGVNNSDANLELTFQSPVTAAAFFYAQSGILSSGEACRSSARREPFWSVPVMLSASSLGSFRTRTGLEGLASPAAAADHFHQQLIFYPSVCREQRHPNPTLGPCWESAFSALGSGDNIGGPAPPGTVAK